MEHHKCKIFKEDGELFDDNTECWFEIVTREFGMKDAQGDVQASQNLFADSISYHGRYELELDDGRKMKIILTNLTGDEPRRGTIESAGPLK